MRGKGIKLRHSLLAVLYFFFNELGLKGGLLYTHLLTPFFYVWLLFKRKQPVLAEFFLFLIPFDLIHFLLGVDLKTFIISNLLFISTYIFVVTFSYFIREYDLSRIMKQLLGINFLLTLVAIVIYFTPYRSWLWYVNNFSQSLLEFSRLGLFTSESSLYSTLFVPVAFYYLLKVFLKQNEMPAPLVLLMVAMPLLLSLSLGVLGAIGITFFIFFAINYRQVMSRKRFFNVFTITILSGCALLFLLFLVNRNNAVFVRLQNIISGNDSSAQGRLSDSFMIAWMVAKEKSVLFGAGLGQVKVLAYDIVKKYFGYWGEMRVYRIPNTVAETLAIFGIAGLLFRFGLIFYLFFKTRVFSNYYRMSLFIYIFIYQFTGSFITNIAEYAIWALAFSNVFPQFNSTREQQLNLNNGK